MRRNATQIELMLVIFGEYFSLDELSVLLGINPTDSWYKGDVIPLHKGLFRKDNKPHLRRETTWQFSTGFIETLYLDDVFILFERQFEDKISILKNYIKAKKLDVAIEIVIEIVDNEVPSLYFDKRIIRICDELEAEIDIDMYVFNAC